MSTYLGETTRRSANIADTDISTLTGTLPGWLTPAQDKWHDIGTPMITISNDGESAIMGGSGAAAVCTREHFVPAEIPVGGAYHFEYTISALGTDPVNSSFSGIRFKTRDSTYSGPTVGRSLGDYYMTHRDGGHGHEIIEAGVVTATNAELGVCAETKVIEIQHCFIDYLAAFAF